MTVTITFGWPQAIYVVLAVFSLVHDSIEHGKPRSPTNAWVTFVSIVFVSLPLLWWGGFFG